MNNVSRPLAKSVNASVASTADKRIHKSIRWLRNYNTSKINEEINNIIKILKSLEDFYLEVY